MRTQTSSTPARPDSSCPPAHSTDPGRESRLWSAVCPPLLLPQTGRGRVLQIASSPAVLLPCSRRGQVRHSTTSSSARHRTRKAASPAVRRERPGECRALHDGLLLDAHPPRRPAANLDRRAGPRPGRTRPAAVQGSAPPLRRRSKRPQTFGRKTAGASFPSSPPRPLSPQSPRPP